MSLYHKYRPQTLEDVYGNKETIQTLDAVLSREDVPHAFLLTGPTGTGKTTVARIIANRLSCAESSFQEINASDFRGIDTIREIRQASTYQPLEGKCRVWLIDECFAKGTPVSLSQGGSKPIEQIKVGMKICNLQGDASVLHTRENKVSLDRVVKVIFSDNREIICSKEHKFLTNSGWKSAIDLNNTDLTFLRKGTIIKHNIDSQEGVKKYGSKESLSTLRQRIKQKSSQVLLQFLSVFRLCQTSDNRSSNMPHLWDPICSTRCQCETNVFQEMWQYFSRTEKSRSCKKYRNKDSIVKKLGKISFKKPREIQRNNKELFQQNEGKQSLESSRNCRKNEVNKKNEWNITYLERRKGWKRTFYRASSFIVCCFRMAYGGCDSYGVLLRQRWLPYKLQSRYRKCCSQISDRSGWKGTQFERRALERQEERGQIETVRVASVTIYQRGSNEESFRGTIGNQEKDQGYVIFYDLEIEGHPSYFANGILVHNCHILTNIAQNALLKLLEDPPKHVYLILATTDPQNLLATIKGRCATFEMGILTDKEMYKLLRKVVIEEKAVIEKEVYNQIIQDSLGHPRNALQILDSVLAVEPEMQLSVAKKSAELQSKAIELCRVITNPNASWKKVSTILLGLKDEQAETIRRAILGYCQAILLKNANDHVAFVMEQFLEPFYNTGFPGLTYACYYVVKGEN